jgi:hypothetical protein
MYTRLLPSGADTSLNTCAALALRHSQEPNTCAALALRHSQEPKHPAALTLRHSQEPKHPAALSLRHSQEPKHLCSTSPQTLPIHHYNVQCNSADRCKKIILQVIK